MTRVNKGIINTGRIGGNATVTVTEQAAGSVMATDATVDARTSVRQMIETLEARRQQGQPAESEALTAALVRLARELETAAETRATEVNALLSAIDSLSQQVSAGKTGEAARRLGARILDIAGRLADVAPDVVRLARQIGALLAL